MLYGSSKAALEYLTRAWASELAADRIRVNCIAPGPVDTPIHATYSDDLEATYADLARRIPLQRMGQPADLAAWVWFLVSPAKRLDDRQRDPRRRWPGAGITGGGARLRRP